MNESKLPVIGISIGDPNGVGPEIILKALEDSRVYEMFTPVIFAGTRLVSYYIKHLGLKTKFNGVKSLDEVIPGKLNVLRLFKEPYQVQWGEVSKEAGLLSVQSFKEATAALKTGDIDVLVTAPIHKEAVQSDGFKFPGHTDYLGQALDGDPLMLMVSDQLRVGLITDHLPIDQVNKAITPELVSKKVLAVRQTLLRDFAITQPKIAVLSINPHVGDNGVIGDDDQRKMIPVLEKMREEGHLVFGPYAADSFFGQQKYKQFDAVLSPYHDQGLVPFKTISFGEGVNYTAGLEKVRTSPDHGTAFDIAGKGTADTTSFKEAIRVGIEVFKNRKMHKELTKDPLKISVKKRRSY